MHERDWPHTRPSNIQHGAERPRPVSRGTVHIAFAVLALSVVEVWRMIGGAA